MRQHHKERVDELIVLFEQFDSDQMSKTRYLDQCDRDGRVSTLHEV